MKIFLISDLHITCEGLSRDAEKILDKFCDCIQNESNHENEIVIFVLGDIIDKGKPEAFTKAIEVFDNIKKQLKGKSVIFECLPGNHDYCNGSIDEFNEFTSKICDFPNKFGDRNSYCKDYGGVNFIFTDSLIHGIYNNKGEVDLESIKECVCTEKNNVLLFHHSFYEEDCESHSSIIKSTNILKDLYKVGVNFFFTAHTHTSTDDSIGDINIISNGSLLQDLTTGVDSEHMKNVNNQFHIIEICRSSISKIYNGIYMGGKEKFFPVEIWTIPLMQSPQVHKPSFEECQEVAKETLKQLKKSIIELSMDDKDILYNFIETNNAPLEIEFRTYKGRLLQNELYVQKTNQRDINMVPNYIPNNDGILRMPLVDIPTIRLMEFQLVADFYEVLKILYKRNGSKLFGKSELN